LYRDMIRRGYGKKLRRFCNVHCLETEVSLRKNLGIEREWDRFEGEVLVQSSFDLETFSIHKIDLKLYELAIFPLT